jgi:N4-gp56 family major capsid protein
MSGLVQGTDTSGGYLAPDHLQQAFLLATEGKYAFRQFAQIPEDGFGPGMGASYKANILSKISTQGGLIAETATIPLRDATVGQAEVLIGEYGNGISNSQFLALTASQNPEQGCREILGQDARITLETAAEAACDKFIYRYVGSGTAAGSFTSNGTATATNASALNAYHVGKIRDYMLAQKIPVFFENGYYAALVSIAAARNIKNDSTFLAWKQYAAPEQLLSGEIGSLDGVRFMEATEICSDSGPFDNSIGAGATGEAYFMGAQALIEAQILKEHVRQELADFGRNMKYAWYAVTGFGSIRNHGLKWTSV